MTERELEEVLRECDKDEDSMISFSEFTAMMFSERSSNNRDSFKRGAARTATPTLSLKAPSSMPLGVNPSSKKLAPLPQQAFNASISVLGPRDDEGSDRGSASSTDSTLCHQHCAHSVINPSLVAIASEPSIVQV